MSSTFTANLGLEEPSLGDYVNGWNVPVNGNFSLLDQASGNSALYSSTGGTLTLTTAQCAFDRIYLSGALASNLTVVFPVTLGGRKNIFNSCTGAFTVTVKSGPADGTGGVIVPVNLFCPVILNQGQSFYDDYQAVPPGTILCFAGLAAPPGFLLCDGSSYAKTSYPQLAGGIGNVYGGAGPTFNVPDSRGRILAGADDMGGSAAGRLTGYTLATTGGEQTHTLITTELASHTHTDSGHTHTASDAGHTHGPGSGSAFLVNGGSGSIGTGGATFAYGVPAITATGNALITVASGTANIQNAGGGGAHNNIQPTIAINHIIRF